MAKNNNLTDFLTGLADKFRNKLSLTGNINPQDFESKIDDVYTAGLQAGGCTVATAEAHNTAKSMSITFTGLAKEPKMFSCVIKASTSSSDVVSLTTDGTNTYSILGTTYKDDAFTWEYANGSLTITLAAKYYSWYFAYNTRPGSYVYYELIYAY